jgi:hypothetical protein
MLDPWPHLTPAHRYCRSDAWSSEANRIARLFSAMSNHASYTPSILFIVWSTDHVAQHSEAITRKVSLKTYSGYLIILIAVYECR